MQAERHLQSVETSEQHRVVLIASYWRQRNMTHHPEPSSLKRNNVLLGGILKFTELKFRNQKKQKQKILTMRAHFQGVTGFISLRREKQKGWCLKLPVNEVSIHKQTLVVAAHGRLWQINSDIVKNRKQVVRFSFLYTLLSFRKIKYDRVWLGRLPCDAQGITAFHEGLQQSATKTTIQVT